MRLIGTFATEKEAYNFYSFLLKERIQNIYELGLDQATGIKEYRIWIYDENDLDSAQNWLEKYRQSPDDPCFQAPPPPTITVIPPSPAYAEMAEKEDQKWQSIPSARLKIRRFSFVLTRFIIVVCGILFLWNGRQESALAENKGSLAAQIAMTPLQQDLLFDDPASYRYVNELIETVPIQEVKELKELPPEAVSLLKKAEEAPSWRGLYPFFQIAHSKGWDVATSVPLFEKIRQGELWRLFTPCLMHRDFLHILFNMVWAWILIKQLESRMSKWKICILILIIGVISNVAQYLLSGPYFLGFSGVIVGLAAFIWVRQRRAPWEGYSIQKSTLLFLLFFVLAMFLIELFTFLLQLFSVIEIAPNIANTAHIMGGLVGLVLGRVSFFGRKAP